MAAVTVGDVPEEARHEKKSISDPACGSGRMLLAVAEMHPHWLFVGQDVDLRCVRMCAINLALRNLYGYVIQGNSLANERRLVYRTGFDLVGVISEICLQDCPPKVQEIATQAPEDAQPPSESSPTQSEAPVLPKKQLGLF